jgi:nicotinate dehydrogenase subunit A
MAPSKQAATPTAVTVRINGQPRSLQVDAQARLLDVLRDTLGLKGVRFGCGANQCGACHVLVDGHSVASCDTPMWAVDQKDIVTLEGLGTPAAPHALQAAFLAEQAAQCGFCTAGMLISAAALLKRQPRPTAADVRSALDGHLCRCGTHNRIVRAVLRAADEINLIPHATAAQPSA